MRKWRIWKFAENIARCLRFQIRFNCTLYRQFTCSVSNADQHPQKINQWKVGSRHCSLVSTISYSRLQISEIVPDSSVLRRRMAQTFADCNRVQKGHANDDFFNFYDMINSCQGNAQTIKKCRLGSKCTLRQPDVRYWKWTERTIFRGNILDKLRWFVFQFILWTNPRLEVRLWWASSVEHRNSSMCEGRGRRREW